MSVRIVTDSTADIPLEQARALGITIVPLTLFFGEESYLDAVELDNSTFYTKLKSSTVTPRTSQPAPAAFAEAYQRLIEDGANAILSVHLSARLSGTYQSACAGRDALPESLKRIPIEVVDSESVSMAMGLAILHAAEEAKANDGMAEIKSRLLDRLARTHIYFMVDTLEYLRRGGRIGNAKALLGSMLSVKPILSLKDGQIIPLEQPRTRSKACERIAQLAQAMQPWEEMAIVAADEETNQQLTQALSHMQRTVIPGYKLGAVVGTYAGPGAGGVVIVRSQTID